MKVTIALLASCFLLSRLLGVTLAHSLLQNHPHGQHHPHARRLTQTRSNARQALDISDLLTLLPGGSGPKILELKQSLAQLGYLRVTNWTSSSTPLNISNLSDLYDQDLQTAITRFQLFYNLDLTNGLLNKAVLDKLLSRRCGFPDIINRNFWDGSAPDLSLTTYPVLGVDSPPAVSPASGQTRRRLHFDFSQGNPKWTKTALTYAIDQQGFTTDVTSPSAVVGAFKAAFQTWQAVTPLTFTQVTDVETADIKIRFRTGTHQEPRSMGTFGASVLAHAYSPEFGELHMNDAILWEVDATGGVANGFDVQSVAVHELGHILGLSHSDVEDAIMYPSIPNDVNKRDLANDDMAGIQQLYPGGGAFTAPPPPPFISGGAGDSSCTCGAVDGWGTHASGSQNCTLYCYCSGGSGQAYKCEDGLRMAADSYCYPPSYFPSLCDPSTDGASLTTSPSLPPDRLLVDPSATVISRRGRPVKYKFAQAPSPAAFPGGSHRRAGFPRALSLGLALVATAVALLEGQRALL